MLERDLGERISQLEMMRLFSEFDLDKNGKIDFSEFVRGVTRYVQSNSNILNKKKERGLSGFQLNFDEEERQDESGEDGGEGEEEEMPEDLLHLSPEEQQRRLKARAAWFLGLGTALVLLFSDPMVNVLSEIGSRTVSYTSTPRFQ